MIDHDSRACPVEERAGRSRRKWLPILGWAALLLFLILGGWAYFEVTGRRELLDALAAADRQDPGWRLEDLEAKRAALPDDENAARWVLRIEERLPQGWPDNAVTRALAAVDPQVQLTADQVTALLNEMEQVELALLPASRLAGLPRGRYAVQWTEDGAGTLLAHLDQVRRVSRLLSFHALLRAHEGDAEGAWGSCVGAFNACRSIGDEPLLFSQLVRTFCQTQALRQMERTLAQGQVENRSLKAAQALLADEAAQPLLLFSYRGVRAGYHRLMTAVDTGRLSLAQLVANAPGNGFEKVIGRWTAGLTSKQAHAFLIQHLTDCVEIAKLPWEERASLLEKKEMDVKGAPAAARLLLPDFTEFAATFQRRQADLECAVVALAVERYRLLHGRWPASPAEVTPALLGAIPTDPYDGMPLRYRRLDDGVVIYSLGPDGLDNGGKIDRGNAPGPGADLGFRLWDVGQRRQRPSKVPKAR